MSRSLAFFLPHYRTDFALSANRLAILIFPTLALPQTPAEVFPAIAPSFWRGFFWPIGYKVPPECRNRILVTKIN